VTIPRNDHVGHIDLDLAAAEIELRRAKWASARVDVGDVTWREQGEGWPPTLKTERRNVRRADSIGVTLRKDEQEASVVLFNGGWADIEFWTGHVDDIPLMEAAGWEDWLDVPRFAALLDRVTAMFA
jgi:hypothetical protein